MVLILGAGLAGLSAAWHLEGREVLVLERNQEVGGLCRSFRERGFTFDCVPHLLHMRNPEMRDWVLALVPGGWRHLKRSAWVHSHGRLVPYPFQANTAGLPLRVRLECLIGFLAARRGGRGGDDPVPASRSLHPGLPFVQGRPEPGDDEPSFHDWIRSTFGRGFARHFFDPYNAKLWRRDLREVTGDWVSWSIPRPSFADVLLGAITRTDKAFGYNPEFLYPHAGGIDALAQAIAAGLRRGIVRTGCTVAALHARPPSVTLADGATLEANVILSSIPLPALARLTRDLPSPLRADAGALRHVSVRVVNLGVRGAPIHPGVQWVYAPDPALPFHRVGLPAALTPAMAPPGHHSLVAEISFLSDDAPAAEDSLEETLRGLVAMGLLRARSDVVYTRVVDIPEAYVVFDRARRRVVPELLRWFLQRDVVPIGRYGTWDYLAMEDSLLHGRQAAQWIREHRP